MRLLGVIKNVNGEPRRWMSQDGPVYFFQMIFEAEGNQFLGEYAIAPARLASLGIRPGAVGYMDIKLSVRDGVSKSSGEAYLRQDIKFSKFSLANAGAPVAQEHEEQHIPTPEEVLEEVKKDVEEAQVDGTGMPF